jgi:NitT/TauT family transport system permease protein
VLLALIGLWYIVSYLLLDTGRRFLLPPPHACGPCRLPGSLYVADLLDGLWLSTRVAFLGFAVAIVVG